MRTSALRRFAVIGCLLSVTVAGCSGGDPEADPTPIIASPTEEPTTSAPAEPEPEPWEVRSRAGVKAFLQRYVEVFSEAERTGDTTAYRSLSHNCDACDQIADQIDEVYAAGGRIQSQPSKFTGWSIDEDGVRDGAACILTYTAAPTTWTRKAGAKPETFPGGPSEEALQLTWLDGEWRIASLTILNPQG